MALGVARFPNGVDRVGMVVWVVCSRVKTMEDRWWVSATGDSDFLVFFALILRAAAFLLFSSFFFASVFLNQLFSFRGDDGVVEVSWLI